VLLGIPSVIGRISLNRVSLYRGFTVVLASYGSIRQSSTFPVASACSRCRGRSVVNHVHLNRDHKIWGVNPGGKWGLPSQMGRAGDGDGDGDSDRACAAASDESRGMLLATVVRRLRDKGC
jgi:hypothetical protein